MAEEKVGEVFSFFKNVSVAAVNLTDGGLAVGDTIRVKGNTTDFTMKVESMQIERAPVREAARGSSVGIKVPERVRPRDTVFKVAGEG